MVIAYFCTTHTYIRDFISYTLLFFQHIRYLLYVQLIVYVFGSQCNLSTSHSGWTILLVPADASCQVLRVELKGSSNNVRVRQLQVLAKSGAQQEPCIPAVVAQQRSCEVEALRIFRLLTSQVSD